MLGRFRETARKCRRIRKSVFCYLSWLPMSGDDDSTATLQAIQSLLRVIRDVARLSANGFKGVFKKECTQLSRRVALLSPLFEEIRDFLGDPTPLSTGTLSTFRGSLSELTETLLAARRVLQSERAALKFIVELQSVTCKLENALANFPYDDFEISEDVRDQVELVRGQLKRGYGTTINIHNRVRSEVVSLKTSDAAVIPNDFLCPISRDLFRDPVVVSTGQTYERSYIQRWINNGNRICPKSCQTLENLTLTPNYVLRSLIAEWCRNHTVKPPTLPKRKINPIIAKPLSQYIQEESAFERRAGLILDTFRYFNFLIRVVSLSLFVAKKKVIN